MTMNIPEDEIRPLIAVARLPVWLTISGLVILLGTGVLAARLVWEQTVWTWERGPQMIGFSLAHGSGAILFLFPILLLLWGGVVVVLTAWSLVRKNRIDTKRWAALGFVASLLIAISLPADFWQRLFVNHMAASSHAGDLLVYAAYRGDLGTVRAFISHGVPVDAADHVEWRTALHAAAVAGDLSLLRYLVASGAILTP
jgi:hypothetical protein